MSMSLRADGHSCAVDVDGALHCWGGNWANQNDVHAGTYTAVDSRRTSHLRPATTQANGVAGANAAGSARICRPVSSCRSAGANSTPALSIRTARCNAGARITSGSPVHQRADSSRSVSDIVIAALDIGNDWQPVCWGANLLHGADLGDGLDRGRLARATHGQRTAPSRWGSSRPLVAR